MKIISLKLYRNLKSIVESQKVFESIMVQKKVEKKGQEVRK